MHLSKSQVTFTLGHDAGPHLFASEHSPLRPESVSEYDHELLSAVVA